jgi:hypothetical protein
LAPTNYYKKYSFHTNKPCEKQSFLQGFFANQSYLKTWKESLLILLSVVSDSGRLLPTDNMGKRM